ncbi:hypothetical protein [Paractinoplanes rishiriensis]|uniref:Uncharacterized protein n=1 Tax=Paractinoplanes rishiriensis TaxID=1050105 RepID=A0A919K6B4_9ACTN|nr:hypothetical protein [Actinoplanes rishiriensis]GIE97421.1 hypothetical protein Ari01nite_48860 [Actinoplanes rishiriensis]
MGVGSAHRRRELRPRLAGLFPPEHVDAALDLLLLADMAWHDCYGPRDLEIPAPVLDDVLLLAKGDLTALIRLSLQAVQDFRDVRVAANAHRAEAGPAEPEEVPGGARILHLPKKAPDGGVA